MPRKIVCVGRSGRVSTLWASIRRRPSCAGWGSAWTVGKESYCLSHDHGHWASEAFLPGKAGTWENSKERDPICPMLIFLHNIQFLLVLCQGGLWRQICSGWPNLSSTTQLQRMSCYYMSYNYDVLWIIWSHRNVSGRTVGFICPKFLISGKESKAHRDGVLCP